jgi:hypothetical protein
VRVNRKAEHYDRVLARTRRHFLELRGAGDFAKRQAEIARLPSKDWNGVRVYGLWCYGDYGQGPHAQFVPEYLLWSLIGLDGWRCPHHQR